MKLSWPAGEMLRSAPAEQDQRFRVPRILDDLMSSEATVTNDILTTPALELGRRIAAREQSSTEVTGAFLDQIDAVEPAVHAFLAVDRDLALRRAGEVDAQIAAGERLSPLAGVPVAVKDLLCYQGLPTTAASRILEGGCRPMTPPSCVACRQADW